MCGRAFGEFLQCFCGFVAAQFLSELRAADQIESCGKLHALVAEGFAEDAFQAVALDGIAVSAADDDAEAGGVALVGRCPKLEQSIGNPNAAADHFTKPNAGANTAGTLQTRVGGGQPLISGARKPMQAVC